MAKTNKKEMLFHDFPPVEKKKWIETIKKELKGKDFEKTLLWKTYEGLNLQPFYTEKDIAPSHSQPGEFPFIRGNNTNSNSWLINEIISESNPLKANKAALKSIENGADSITFDCVVVKDQKNLESLLKNIDTRLTEINFSPSGNSKEFLSFLLKYEEYYNNNLKGSYFFDPNKDLAVSGVLNEEIFLDLKENINFFNEKVTHYRIFTVHSYPFKLSGGNIVQELAFSLNSAVEYITRLISLGFGIDFILSKIAFSYSIGSNFFMEIAKLRAARLIWAKIVEQYKPKKLDSYKMYIHTHTAHFNKTIYDPYVNILRGATETIAAAIGGANSITVTPFDFYYKKPDKFSKRISRNTQLIIRDEAYLDKVIDPGAGSYYVEWLTESIAIESLKLFQHIEKNGGFVEAFKAKTIQKLINKNRENVEENINSGKEVFLGTNQYPIIDETVSDKITKKEESFSANNNNTEFETLNPVRGSKPFENLRILTEKNTKKTPKVFLLQLGNLAMRNARANFSRNFFGCAGFKIIDNSGFDTIADGVKAALDTKAEIIVICSSNKEYFQIVPETVKKLKSKNPEIKIVVAGYSEELKKKLEDIDDFIYDGSNLIEILSKYQKLFGINVN